MDPSLFMYMFPLKPSGADQRFRLGRGFVPTSPGLDSWLSRLFQNGLLELNVSSSCVAEDSCVYSGDSGHLPRQRTSSRRESENWSKEAELKECGREKFASEVLQATVLWSRLPSYVPYWVPFLAETSLGFVTCNQIMLAVRTHCTFLTDSKEDVWFSFIQAPLWQLRLISLGLLPNENHGIVS